MQSLPRLTQSPLAGEIIWSDLVPNKASSYSQTPDGQRIPGGSPLHLKRVTQALKFSP